MALLGKPLPAFSAGDLDFLKGDPTDIPATGQPCIVELWATWCGPCRAVFLHLSKIAKKHRDAGLTVVGVSLEEGGKTPQLEQFVRQQGSNMDYKVAVDKPSGKSVGQSLMAAAQVSGIPHAFVVDRSGTVQYSGHPADPKFQAAVEQVVAAPAPAPARQLPPISQTREELMAQPVRELKRLLQERSISVTGLAEKQELVDLILERCSRVDYFAAS